MDLDRGTLARIDRRLLAGLHQDESFRMVRVPVTEAACDVKAILRRGRDPDRPRDHRADERELVGTLSGGDGDSVAVLTSRAEESARSP